MFGKIDVENSEEKKCELKVIAPCGMEDARMIVDELQKEHGVIINLEKTKELQRIEDFVAGACYSMGGTYEKVGSILIATPNVFNVSFKNNDKGLREPLYIKEEE